MAYIDETGLAEVTTKLKAYVDSKAGGSGAKIRCAEMPDVTLTLSQNGTDIESKQTPTTTGGIVDFEVSATGTYTITATGAGITTWTHNVEVTELGTITECKAGVLANYTYAQWHTALQGGYFSKMFSIRDTFVYSQVGNLLNNEKFFVEDIEKSVARETVHIRSANGLYYNVYDINTKIAWVTSTSATSWTTNTRNFGGFKYSEMIKRMLVQGKEIYSQATSILPDDYTGTLTTGIKFSDLKYTNGNSCPIYEYNSVSDTLTLLATCRMSAPNNTGIMMMKGYFKSVGVIDETTFNAGVYYTVSTVSSTSIYTKATTYDSSTTYYGLYETLQENGIFADALLNSDFANYLVEFTDHSSCGGTQQELVNSYNVYCDIPAIEEILGVNKNTTLISGNSAVTVSALNMPGEGSLKPAYNFITQTTGENYFTRSTPGNYNSTNYIVSYNGSINTGTSAGVRLGFRLE